MNDRVALIAFNGHILNLARIADIYYDNESEELIAHYGDDGNAIYIDCTEKEFKEFVKLLEKFA